MVKVSICIPTYKEADLLKKVLYSIQQQVFTDYEVIISDDTQDDVIKIVLTQFDFKDKLKYIQHSPSLGSPANWNFALKEAKGKYIKIMHHDDYFTKPYSLSMFVSLLDKNPKALLAFSATEIDLVQLKMKNLNRCSTKKLTELKQNPNLLFFSNIIGAPSATIIRNDFEIFFDEKLKWLVDVDWYIQLINKCNIVEYHPEPLICTIHGSEGQVTQQVILDRDIQIKEHIYLFKKIVQPHHSLSSFSLLFQVLFNKFKINSFNELTAIVTI